MRGLMLIFDLHSLSSKMAGCIRKLALPPCSASKFESDTGTAADLAVWVGCGERLRRKRGPVLEIARGIWFSPFAPVIAD